VGCDGRGIGDGGSGLAGSQISRARLRSQSLFWKGDLYGTWGNLLAGFGLGRDKRLHFKVVCLVLYWITERRI